MPEVRIPDSMSTEHARIVRARHTDAMTALAADVHPYSAEAIRQNETDMEQHLAALVAELDRAEEVTARYRRETL